MIRCKSCGSENNDNLAFCIDCGSEKSPSQASVSSNPTPMSPTQDIASSTKVACPHCQKLNSFYLTFCDHCGKNMKYDDCNQKNFLSREEMKLTGIGGWLILPIIGLSLSVLFNFLASFAAYALSNNVVEVPDYLVPILNFEVVINFLFAIACIIALVLLIKKKRIFPKIVIGIYVASCLFVIIDTMWISSTGSDISYLISGIVRVILTACIWIPYFLISKRVKYTFTK